MKPLTELDSLEDEIVNDKVRDTRIYIAHFESSNFDDANNEIFRIPISTKDMNGVIRQLQEPVGTLTEYSEIDQFLFRNNKKIKATDRLLRETDFTFDFLKDFISGTINSPLPDKNVNIEKDKFFNCFIYQLFEPKSTKENNGGDNKHSLLSFYFLPIFKHMFVDEKYFINLGGVKMVKNKLSTTKLAQYEVASLSKGMMSLPTNKCFLQVNLFASKDAVKEDPTFHSMIKIFDLDEFSRMFHFESVEQGFAEKKLEKFQNGQLSVTSGDLPISFIGPDGQSLFKDVVAMIKTDENLFRPFASFSSNKRKAIHKVTPDQFVQAIDRLKGYAKSNNSKFKLKNIPVVCSIKDNKTKEIKITSINVTVDSVPIMAALLDNKVVSRILNDDITIPYYDQIEEINK